MSDEIDDEKDPSTGTPKPKQKQQLRLEKGQQAAFPPSKHAQSETKLPFKFLD